LGNFFKLDAFNFKLDAFKRRVLSLGRRQNGKPQPCSFEEKGSKLSWGVISLGEKRIKLPWGATSFREKRIKGKRSSLREEMDLEI